MKVLIVADSNTVVEKMSSFLEKRHFDVICYRWLLKALDNVEEIAAQVIFVSAIDYPRHWKTFIQYIRGVMKPAAQPVIFLLSSEDFSEEEKRKAMCLGVRSVIKGLSDAELSQIEDLLPVQQPQPFYISAEEKFFTPENKQDKIDLPQSESSFSFVNPKTNTLVTGEVKKYEKPIIHFSPNSESDILGIRLGQIISNCDLTVNGNHIIAKVQVQSTMMPIMQFCVLSQKNN